MTHTFLSSKMHRSILQIHLLYLLPVADLHRHILDARPPSRPNFLHFHAVFRKIRLNNRFTSPHWGWCPIWKIQDQLLIGLENSVIHLVNTLEPVILNRNDLLRLFYFMISTNVYRDDLCTIKLFIQ